jgi:hypothetical protein
VRVSTLSLVIVLLGIVCFAVGLFYLVPGPYHPLTFSGTPTDSHKTHAIVFFALGVLALIGSRFVSNGSDHS